MNIATPFLWLVYIIGGGLIVFVMMKLFKTMFPQGIKSSMITTPGTKPRSVVDASTEELNKNKEYLEEQMKKIEEEKKRREGAKETK